MPEDDMMAQLRLQKEEFEALARLAKSYKAMPAVVDDGYPEARHYYERDLQGFIAALVANGRVQRRAATKIDEIVEAVAAALAKARGKFPPFNSGHEGYAVILEELDELWAEVRSNQAMDGREARMREEAVQVAAMALRFLVDMPNFKN